MASEPAAAPTAPTDSTNHGLRVKETKGRNIRTVSLPQEGIEALERVKAAQDRIPASDFLAF